MDLRRVGNSGLRVASVGLGTLTWGRDTDEHEAEEQLRAYLDAGGNLVDTSATYGDGTAEEVIGALLERSVDREEVLLCSKAGVRTDAAGARPDTSRGALLDSLDASLDRLGTDHLDLWLVQAPDGSTPLRETLSALRAAVASGRTRYVGLSNFPAWQLARAATLLDTDETFLTAAQMEYSLLQRGIERELVPAADACGVGILAWSPLGRGVLSGKYRRSVPADSRGASPHLRGFVEPYLTAHARSVVEAVSTAAEGLGRSPVEVALAWVRDAPGVASAVVGARTPAQLRGSLAASDLELPGQIRQVLDEVTEVEFGYPERR
ncbi:aldo/keto reductase [Pseudactinotalea sp. Z1739]|uniref:aldo/keto reductase n=1 Tax=Pseudactinotalea sp. Z1739 TaxID=3413028 RepID=UPI003C7B76D1